ncbi:MAG TPA: hypothetical protein PLU72_16680 [Candidatus Ozemobacteraceae bacterium]|nr:hypothetical protein [Candidatus Ozemobacteraceae bacterium]HQG27350.1 hypothetical protein [Candidatus Ozemobacteraceae bacterium]
MKHALTTAFWIGWYGFLEALRSRLLLGILLLLLPLTASAWLLDVYRIGFQVKVVKDLGMNLASLFGLMIVLFLSFEQILPDIERRTIYFILTRYNDRRSYLLGRFLGVAGTLAFFHALMGLGLLLLLRWHDGAWFWEVPVGSLVLFLKQSVVVAVILLLAIVTTRIVVLSLTVLVYVLGHGLDVGRMLLDKHQVPALSWLLEAVALVLPDFTLFEMRMAVVHDAPIQAGAVALLSAYTALLCLFYLAAGAFLLSRRDL